MASGVHGCHDGGEEGSDDDFDFLESLRGEFGSFGNTVNEFVEKQAEDLEVGKLGHDNGENDGYGDISWALNSEENESESSDGDDESEDEDSPTGGLVCADVGDDGSEHADDEFAITDTNGPPTEMRVQEDLIGSRASSFILGGTYTDKKELVRAIDDYAIQAGVKLRLVKSEPLRVKAKCEKGCPFVLYASKDGSNPGLVVKTLLLEHSCSRVFKNPRATVKWLAGYFRSKVQERPKYKVADMKKDVEVELKLNVSKYKCKRAKRLIMEELEGSYIDEFNNLEAYCNELKKSNPGSDVSIELSKEALENGKRVFSRIYISFHASKTGWKAGCRPIIGVDGTFLKGNARGILLTAIGLDADDSLFPIAMGITQKENTLNWKWFIEWLKRSLDLENGQLVTIMSDMQKV